MVHIVMTRVLKHLILLLLQETRKQLSALTVKKAEFEN